MLIRTAPEGLLPAGGLATTITVGARGFVAFDVLGPYGAVFSVWLSDNGEIDLEAEILKKESEGRWAQMGSGGNTRAGWDVPFPPASGWPFEGLAIFGTSGLDIEDDDGSDAAIDAVFGFLAPPAVTLRIDRDGVTRELSPFPGTHAFVALTIGVDLASIAAHDANGVRIGAPEHVGHQPYNLPSSQ